MLRMSWTKDGDVYVCLCYLNLDRAIEVLIMTNVSECAMASVSISGVVVECLDSGVCLEDKFCINSKKGRKEESRLIFLFTSW